MLLAPKPDFKYRDTATKQLVPAEGFDADPNDLDIARALAVGDLVPVETAEPAASKAASARAKD